MKSNTKASRKPLARTLDRGDKHRERARSKTERGLLNTKHPMRSGRRKHAADLVRNTTKGRSFSNPARCLNILIAS